MSATTEILGAVPMQARTASLRKWAPLPVVLAGVFMVVLDFFIVNVAMPTMQGELHAGASAIQWVVGWPAWTWASFAAAGVLMVVFGLRQRRVARTGGSPLVPPELFAALQSGLVFGFEGIGFFATTLTAGRFVARLGRQALALGALVRAVALVALYVAVDHVGAHGSVAWLAGPLMLDGAGIGLVMGPIIAIVLSGVEPRHAGAASGVLASAQQVGNALGVAIVGIVYCGALAAGHSVPDAFRTSLLWLAAGSVAVVALVQTLPRGERAAG
jgi:MFS family permease